jgi:hypothetical protein
MIGRLFSKRGDKVPGAGTTPRLVATIKDEGAVVCLKRGDEPLPFQEWAQATPAAYKTAQRLLDEAANSDGQLQANVHLEGANLVIPHDAVSDLNQSDAKELGLPPLSNLALQLLPNNRIDQDSFFISTDWVRASGQSARALVRGAFVEYAGECRRIPKAALELYEAAQDLSQPKAKSERFEILARLGADWPENAEPWLQTEGYLSTIRVHYASRLSLSLTQLTADTTQFEPVLFGAARSVDDESSMALDEVDDSVLTPAAQKLFAQDRFRREPSGRDVYLLKDGAFVFIDPDLRPALDAVRRMQDRPEREKRDFVLNPRSVLRRMLSDEVADKLDLEALFVETEQFSERVSGVDVWRSAVLPWLTPSQANKWIPEKFGLRVGDAYFAVPMESAPELVERARLAEESKSEWVNVRGLMEPESPEYDITPPQQLPATPQAFDAIKALGALLTRTLDGSAFDPDEMTNEPVAAIQKLFLVVQENFEEVGFSADTALGKTTPLITIPKPKNLKTALKPHQQEGLDWLCQCHAADRPGALLADDMGLGKTMQALAFMAWLQDRFALNGGAPRILIIAPTALLGNWQAEINIHLQGEKLGPILTAYGSNLRQLREIGSRPSRDIETGRAALQFQEWEAHRVVLTTYETLRDYHFSFARIPFDLVVFDETQKLKNPTSQMTRAAKTLRADFTLALTGTPVENRLQDLWSIFDIVAPGLLGSSRDFERKHPAEDRAALSRLKARLTDPVGGAGPYMLRRMKSDALKGLPAKHIHRIKTEMPLRQAELYKDLVSRAMGSAAMGGGVRGNILTTLALMRGCSLHPVDPSDAPNDLDLYAADSARMGATLAALSGIAEKQEKVLIFLEDLRMQDHLASLIRSRFNLATRPSIINGGVPGARRQALVEQFQSAPKGFDVMILSPKAGGVGLTLTAANHVIHLSRWWNPAVEDQATDRVYRIGQTKDVHVYLPMAVHPNAAISESSFDLRLDALMERKRALTRDLFMPPDASDSDLADLLHEVTTGELHALSTTSVSLNATTSPPLPVPQEANGQARDVAQRPILKLQDTYPAPKIWRVKSGQARPLGEVLALFAKKQIKLIRINDPYALTGSEEREAQAAFLGALASVGATIERVVIHYNDAKIENADDRVERVDMNQRIARAFGDKAPLIELVRPRRGRGQADFHDRSVELDIVHSGGAVRQHCLLTGRGLIALFQDRFECSLTYAPPAN